MQPLTLVGGSLTVQLSIQDSPSPEATYEKILVLKRALDQWARQVALCVNTNQTLSGPTSDRPSDVSLASLPNGGVGWSMLDTTLGLPVWWNGTDWIAADGTIV